MFKIHIICAFYLVMGYVMLFALAEITLVVALTVYLLLAHSYNIYIYLTPTYGHAFMTYIQ